MTQRRSFAPGGTLALPESTEELPNAFGRTPGVVYRVPALGVIAITYDDMIASFLTTPLFIPRSSLRASTPFYRWCPATIGARVARVYVEPTAYFLGTTAVLSFGRAMAITTVTSTGRPVNIRISADLGEAPDRGGIEKVTRLLNLVSTLQWEP